MVEVRFKLADVGTVADGAITNAKINASAGIDQSKLSLAITDAEIADGAIAQAKIADLVTGLAAKVAGTGTTGTKNITKIGWDDATGEVVIDHEA